MKNKIHFKKLESSDIRLLYAWFNKPHVQTFYSLRDWSFDEVLQKMQPILTEIKPVVGSVKFIKLNGLLL